jgi:signal transduction histidine kinase
MPGPRKWFCLLPLGVLLGVCTPHAARAQSVEDSLRRLVAHIDSDTARINKMVQLCFVYQNSIPSFTRAFAQEALAAARRIGYRKGEGDALNRLGGLAEISGNYVMAMDYYLASKKIREEVHDSGGVTASYNNIALVQMHMGYYDRARGNMARAIALAQQLKDPTRIAWYTNGMGIVYREEGRYDSAYYFLRKGLTLRNALGDSNNIYNSYFHLATAYVANGEPLLALPLLKADLSFAKRSGSARGVAYAHLALGKAYHATRRFAESVDNLQKAFDQSSRLGYSEIARDAANYLARSYAAQGRHDKAYVADTLYHYMKDTLANLVNTRRIADLEFNAAMRQQQHELGMEQQRSSSRRQTAVLLAVGLSLSIGLSVLAWRAYGQKNKAHKQLQRQNAEIDGKNLQLQRTMQQLHEAQQNLVTAEKLAALGRVVANVSHELNTPLGVIRASALNMETRLDALMQAVLEELGELSAAERQTLRQLVAMGDASDYMEYSTREERIKRRELEDFFAGAGLPNPAETTSMCLAAGLTNGQKLLPHLHAPTLPKLLQNAVHLRQVRKSLHNIRLSVDKTRKVIQMLRAFGKSRSGFTAEKVLLQHTLTDSLRLYDGNLRDGIIAKVEMADAPCFVQGNAYDLQQVWSHLLTNAIQAMGGKGYLSLHLDKTEKDAVVTFTDSGCGIAAEEQPLVFTPFYTTKSEGEGIGLGLYVSKKIITDHRGTIAFSSAPGQTQFVVTLPLAQ